MTEIQQLREFNFGAFNGNQVNKIYDTVVGQADIMFDSLTNEELLSDYKEEFIAYNQIIDTMIAFGAFKLNICDLKMRHFYIEITAKGKV